MVYSPVREPPPLSSCSLEGNRVRWVHTKEVGLVGRGVEEEEEEEGVREIIIHVVNWTRLQWDHFVFTFSDFYLPPYLAASKQV